MLIFVFNWFTINISLTWPYCNYFFRAFLKEKNIFNCGFQAKILLVNFINEYCKAGKLATKFT